MAVVSDDCLDIEKLGWALMAHGLQLLPRPSDDAVLLKHVAVPAAERATRQSSMLKAAFRAVLSFGMRPEEPHSDVAAHVARACS